MVLLTLARSEILKRCTAVLTAVVLTGALSGCVGPRVTQPDVDPSTLSDGSFLHYVAEMPLVTVDEAYRGILILADGEDTSADFAERSRKLIERGIVNPDWNLQPQNVIDRGSVACMICRVCKIEGGVNMSLFGALGVGDRRYAMRELVYLDMLGDGPDYAPIKGGEFTGVITHADAYMAEHNLYDAPPLDLGSEAEASAKAQG